MAKGSILAAGPVLAALVLAACGTAADGHGGGAARSCRTTVHGVTTSRGALAAGWLPAGFRPAGQSAPAPALPSASYLPRAARPGSPRLELTAARLTGPLTAAATGRPGGTAVTVRGHPGLLAGGPPAPQFAGVYWKPSPRYLISVIGYRVAPAAVLRVARSVSFSPPRVVPLPVAPGPIISRHAAVAAARRWAGAARAQAKLTSPAEASALLGYAGYRTAQGPRPPVPWRPAWAVLLSGSRRWSLIVLDAATGHAKFTAGPSAGSAAWFSALTDRDLVGTGQCQGGSSARLPFGVLTRDEEAYTAGAAAYGRRPRGGERTSLRLVLSTVAAVNRADPSMYGGCVRQLCSIAELVWVQIRSVRAAPGKTLACLPPSADVPVNYHPRRGDQYFAVSVPGNWAAGCGPVPASFRQLTDLAPPLRGN